MCHLYQNIDRTWFRTILCIAIVTVGGCTVASKQLHVKDISASFQEGTILSGKTGMPVSFAVMVEDLNHARIIYVGEQHTNPAHHDIQLRVIEALHKHHADLAVGMEMFDATYQTVLDEWSAGNLDEKIFLKKVHWYANWRYDFKLYQNILLYIKEKKMRLVGLNIPFHLPPKIAIGGIETLSAEDKKHLPEFIDTKNAAHRAYVEEIFKKHHIKGRDNFETFYTAQCVWEDAMADAVARHLKGSKMVVLAGGGHIYRKFGIPDRAFQRTRVPFRTLYLAPIGSNVELSDGDYILATPVSGYHHGVR